MLARPTCTNSIRFEFPNVFGATHLQKSPDVNNKVKLGIVDITWLEIVQIVGMLGV